MSKQVFVADAILLASQMNTLQSNDYNQTVSTKTASYVLVASDAGTKIVMNAGATNTTLTVNTSLFAAGDTLTILNISTSGTCTITAGTATVATAGSLALGLNQGGTLYFTSAGVSIFQADGTVSKIAQVLSTTLTTTFTTTATSFTDITGLTVSITPSSNTSKIFVVASVSGGNDTGITTGGVRLARGGTSIFAGDTAGSRTSGQMLELINAAIMLTAGLSVLDSPSSTSALTYSVQAINPAAGTFFVNRSKTDTNSSQFFRAASSITVMEILA